MGGFRAGATARPEVIAHRGSSDELAEHTIAAYETAIAEGADALECDVRLTADGVLVCVHDRRIDRTSDGRGVVAAKTYAELSGRDYGSWKEGWSEDLDQEPARPDSQYRRLLTLEALLDLVLSSERPIGLAIETKHPTRYAGLVEERLVATLERFGLARPQRGTRSRIRLMSFSEVALRRLRSMAPGIPTVFLMSRVPVRCRNGWLPFGARIAGPGIDVLRVHPGYVRRVHSAGGQVYTWTVDELADIDLCCRLGVDAIITNRPQAVRERLNEYWPAVTRMDAADAGPPAE